MGLISGRLQLISKIGQGGEGSVYRAYLIGSEGFRKLVVAKRLRSGLEASAKARKRLQSEAHLLSSIQHENIVTVLDLIESSNGDLWLIEEHLEGVSLDRVRDAVIDGKIEIPKEVISQVQFQIGNALRYLHSQEKPICHRDVSPHNIVLCTDGTIKLLDFGLAREDDQSSSHSIEGKKGYLHPSYINGAPYSAEFDNFALDLIIAELCQKRRLTGQEFQNLPDTRSVKEGIDKEAVAAFVSAHLILGSKPAEVTLTDSVVNLTFKKTAHGLKRLTYGLFIGCLLAAIAAGYWYSHKVVSPLKILYRNKNGVVIDISPRDNLVNHLTKHPDTLSYPFCYKYFFELYSSIGIATMKNDLLTDGAKRYPTAMNLINRLAAYKDTVFETTHLCRGYEFVAPILNAAQYVLDPTNTFLDRVKDPNFILTEADPPFATILTQARSGFEKYVKDVVEFSKVNEKYVKDYKEFPTGKWTVANLVRLSTMIETSAQCRYLGQYLYVETAIKAFYDGTKLPENYGILAVPGDTAMSAVDYNDNKLVFESRSGNDDAIFKKGLCLYTRAHGETQFVSYWTPQLKGK